MFLQLLTDQQHYTSLWSAAASMRDKIADFGAKVATAGLEPSSSSTPHAGLLLESEMTHVMYAMHSEACKDFCHAHMDAERQCMMRKNTQTKQKTQYYAQ